MSKSSLTKIINGVSFSVQKEWAVLLTLTLIEHVTVLVHVHIHILVHVAISTPVHLLRIVAVLLPVV